MLRNQVAGMAERWGWSRDTVLAMRVRERLAYWYRVMEYAELDKKAARKG